MKRHYGPYTTLFLMLLASFVLRPESSSTRPEAEERALATSSIPDPATQARAYEAYGKLPLGFEPNRGQAPAEVQYLSRSSGYSLYLTPNEVVLSLRGSDRMRMRLIGARAATEGVALNPLPGRSNYFLGNDPAQWRTDIPQYAAVRYENVYPDVDLVYYSNGQQLEYDFIVAPGADPDRIRLGFEEVERVDVDEQGDLLLHLPGGVVRQRKPFIYQETDGNKTQIAGAYVLHEDYQVTFRVAAYDVNRPLVIDPVLSYATYLGGNGNDAGNDIAVDPSGNVYITGTTDSTGFPTANPLQAAGTGGSDVFVAKLNPAGDALLYATYFGGSSDDSGNGIAVDAEGNAYVTGSTESEDFPTLNPARSKRLFRDGFVTKLNPEGNALVYSTHYGDNSVEEYHDIGVDAAGNAYVTGSILISISTGGIDTDVLMGKLDASGSRSLYFFRFGEGGFDKGNGIAVDADGNTYVTGQIQTSSGLVVVGDAFVIKLDPSGDQVYGGRFEGSDDEVGEGIAVDGNGHAYVTGSTTSTDFQTVNPLQATYGGGRDAFVARLNADGDVVFSTYLGGSNRESGAHLTLDADGQVYVTGNTGSTDFPLVDPLQAAFGGGDRDAFMAKVNAEGDALLFSTYLGGNGNDAGNGIALDRSGNAYLIGSTGSTDFPLAGPLQNTFGGGDTDVFVAKIGAVATAVETDAGEGPAAFMLAQNYPNPFNPATTIPFSLSRPAYVTLTVFDLLGREIATLVHEERRAGAHTVRFDAGRLPSGVYVYRLTAGAFTETKAMTLLK